MARAQIVTSGKNPYFRRSKGKGLRAELAAYEQTKAVARAQEQLLAQAWAKAKVTKKDAGKLLVIDAGSGKRYASLLTVPKGRKIFLAKVDRLKRRRLYNPIDERTLARGVPKQKRAMRLTDFDWRGLAQAEPKRFREIMTEMAARGARRGSGWRYADQAFAATTQRGDLDQVAGRVANLYKQAVQSQADHTQWQVELQMMVKGHRTVIPLAMDPLRSYQFFKVAGGGRNRALVYANARSSGLLRAVVVYKLRDVVRRALAERGLVSSASARRVRSLSANRGKAKARWRNAAGAPWAGAHREEVRIEGLEFRLRRLL